VTGSTHWRGRFFSIWTGQQISIIGSRAAQFALVWWLTTTTGSATILATATMVALIPGILLGPFIGALIDRWNRRVVMIAADSFVALVGLWLAYLFWTGAMEVGHVYIVLVARSFGEAFHWPAMAASTSLMVPKRHLTRIGGLNQTVNGILVIAGPVLGAFLMEILPLHGVMLVDVGTAFFAVVPLLFVTIPQPTSDEMDATRAVSVLANLRDGLRFVLGWRGLLVFLGGILVIKVALQPAFSLLPLLVHDHFGGGAADLSYLEACAGGGILLGGAVLSAWGGFRRRIRTILMGVIGLGVGASILGFAPSSAFSIALGGAFVLGSMVAMVDGPLAAILQATVPAGMQGRVFALLGSLFSLSAPIGLAIGGPISDRFGVPFWFQAAGIVSIGVGAIGFFIPALLRIEERAADLTGRRSDPVAAPTGVGPAID